MAKNQKNSRCVMSRKIMRNMVKNKMKQHRIPHVNKNLKTVLNNTDNKQVKKMLEMKGEN